ncbi:hypothetical protein AAG570_009689 [Ranatra chinensis]|uniref:Uncharacterized protein n=1 Tax=Ranatra chinensis TaxID=642074 RepID=A0ABD0YPS7_9HEMI
MFFSIFYPGTVYTPSVLTSPKIVVKDVACGREHGIFLTQTGVVYTWGGGGRGQLGSGSLESSEEPVEVAALSGLKIVAIAAGGWHSCALAEGGILYGWGWNKQGQLGLPLSPGIKNVEGGVEAEPKVVEWPNDIDATVEQIACGTCHTVVMLDDKTVWGCGWNYWGQLSDEEAINFFSMTQLKVPEGAHVKHVVCGAWNTALLCS